MSAEDRVARDKDRIDEWIRYAAESGETAAIAAATVLVLRDGSEGLETLMLRRNSKIAFGSAPVSLYPQTRSSKKCATRLSMPARPRANFWPI